MTINVYARKLDKVKDAKHFAKTHSGQHVDQPKIQPAMISGRSWILFLCRKRWPVIMLRAWAAVQS